MCVNWHRFDADPDPDHTLQVFTHVRKTYFFYLYLQQCQFTLFLSFSSTSYGSGSGSAKMMLILPDPDPQHWITISESYQKLPVYMRAPAYFFLNYNNVILFVHKVLVHCINIILYIGTMFGSVIIEMRNSTRFFYAHTD